MKLPVLITLIALLSASSFAEKRHQLDDPFAPEVKSTMETIVIPKIKFNADLQQICKMLTELSSDADKNGNGFKFEIDDKVNKEKIAGKKFTFDADNMTLKSIVRYISLSSGMSYKVKGEKVIFSTK